jgi:hypothetical protein
MVRLLPIFWKAKTRAKFSGCGEVKIVYQK